MAVNNQTILGRAFLNGTNDFQQRVPDPTVQDMRSTVEFLFEPMNRKYYNEFMDQFINVFGTQVVHQNEWENPLTIFKRESLPYGSTIQESAVKWLRAHTYNVDDDTLLKVNRPEAAVWYHTVNRKDRYDISIEQPDMRQAFYDEYGLNRLINSILVAPRNSDNYDEYLCMMQQFAYYEDTWGFYHHNLTAVPTDEATGKAFLTAVKADASKLRFPSGLYSPVAANYGIPVFAKPSELVLFVTAEVDASVDVNTLASIFQLDKAELPYRKIVVPEFPMPDVFAILTTDQFFVVSDVVYQNESFYNPQTLATNYYLHHWEIVSPSPFVPAIAYTTGTETTPNTITQSVNGVNITAQPTSVEPGGTSQLTVELTGSITDNDLGAEVKPDAVVWSVSAETAASEGEPIALNSRTRVDRLGVLHVQKSDLEAGNVLHVTGTTAYVNPSGATTPYTKTVDVTIA